MSNANNPKIINLPGGWVTLSDHSSELIKECINQFLQTYEKDTGKPLPPNIKITILESASQVVNGINIFLKFTISDTNNTFKPLLITAKFYMNVIAKSITTSHYSVNIQNNKK